MADLYVDKNLSLKNLLHFLPEYLKSGGEEGKLDLETALKGLDLGWLFVDNVEAGDSGAWNWIFVEAIKSGKSLAELKALECCPYRNCLIVYKDGKRILGEVVESLEFLMRSYKHKITEYFVGPTHQQKLIVLEKR
ncbi:MAG: hypothetical protein UU87_C0003G0139 [Parcubacteria group bacterium GW2011_GWA2_42_11]|nr:MAG: hypothetical protein UU87_C0003G0139 [Parcubacteria group bacterium GW2011_GWA2_42_11]KKT76469.1 MAG: hypothetical protein UW72_C0005G0037 [Parcubacteria group bacterium GW2011_GWF2_44_7]